MARREAVSWKKVTPLHPLSVCPQRKSVAELTLIWSLILGIGFKAASFGSGNHNTLGNLKIPEQRHESGIHELGDLCIGGTTLKTTNMVHKAPYTEIFGTGYFFQSLDAYGWPHRSVVKNLRSRHFGTCF